MRFTAGVTQCCFHRHDADFVPLRNSRFKAGIEVRKPLMARSTMPERVTPQPIERGQSNTGSPWPKHGVPEPESQSLAKTKRVLSSHS